MQRLLAGRTTMTDAIMHWQRYAVNESYAESFETV